MSPFGIFGLAAALVPLLLGDGPAMVLPGPPPDAVARCHPHADELAGLDHAYGEKIVIAGLITDNGEPTGTPVAMMEVTASANGTWTFVVTDGASGCSKAYFSGVAIKSVGPIGRGA